MKSHIVKYVSFFSTLLLAAAVINTCGTGEMSKDAMEILRRVPDNNSFLVSIRPGEIIGSQLIQSILLSGKNPEEIENAIRKFKDELGIDPRKDVQRILIMGDDLKNLPHSGCVLIQGNMLPFNAAIDSALASRKLSHRVHSIEGWQVYELNTNSKHKPGKIFVFHDDNEIIVTPMRSIMERMLSVKKGGGQTLANDRDFIRHFQNLKYTRHAWGVVNVEDFIDDILHKVSEKKPELNLQKLDIKALQGGMYLNDVLGMSFEAYCPNQDQVSLLYEALNGFLAFGKLSLGTFPELRKILDGIEILKIEDRVVINTRITLEEFAALEKLKKS